MDLSNSGPLNSGGRIVLHLDRVMLERKISLGELAEKVGITNVNLSKIKNNHITAIRFSTLAALCTALDCQVGYILLLSMLEQRRGKPYQRLLL